MTRKEYLRRRNYRDPGMASLQFEMGKHEVGCDQLMATVHRYLELRAKAPAPVREELHHIIRHPLVALAVLLGFAIPALRHFARWFLRKTE